MTMPVLGLDTSNYTTSAAVFDGADGCNAGLPVLCSGGVASNRQLRAAMERSCGALFAQPCYSTDNAMGVAILTRRALEGGELA